jgi:polysaccharide biosynthesis protein PslH
VPGVVFHEPVVHNILRGHPLRDKAFNLVRSVLKREPYVVTKYRSQKHCELVLRLLQTKAYTFFYFESLSPSYLLPLITSDIRRSTKIVYRAFDIFAETLAGYAQEQGFTPAGLAARLDLLTCQPYERRVWKEVDYIFSVTKRMNEQIMRDTPALAEKLAYLPVTVGRSSSSRTQRPPSKRVLYVGTVHYPPNQTGLKWFIEQCWPLVVAEEPGATFHIVGRGGDHLLPVPSSVQIHNYLDDIEPMYEAADLFVVPLFAGSGVRLKILDALSRGLPVVSTTTGYVGLEVQPGRDLLVADDARLFAAHVLLLLRSNERRAGIAAHGQRFIQQFHSPLLADQALAQLQAATLINDHG